MNADNHDSFFLSQRQHLAVCVDASAKGGQPAPLVHRVHADADTGGPMRNVTAARQHLQSTITELIGKTKQPRTRTVRKYMSNNFTNSVSSIFVHNQDFISVLQYLCAFTCLLERK